MPFLALRHTPTTVWVRQRHRLLLDGTPLAATARAAAASRGCHPDQRRSTHHGAKWRPMSVLDEWVAKEARPISLRQLMVFGRSLTEQRLISSANYVRTELPTRLAHRIRDMQQLPYVVVTNPHISEVYELYYNAFDTFRRVEEIKTLEDNDAFCRVIGQMLTAHLPVIPKLAMGILECGDLMDSAELDRFMNTLLRSRISRRVIAEQHISLTETFHSTRQGGKSSTSATNSGGGDMIGEVLTRCVAADVVRRCGDAVRSLARSTYGPDAAIPEIAIEGHLDANFPYIQSHLEYIVGELLRNSVQAVIERQARLRESRKRRAGASAATADDEPPPIEVTVCEAQQHVIIRVSDRGGGVPRDVLPHLWSFSRGGSAAAREARLRNLAMVPKMAATLQEVRVDDDHHRRRDSKDGKREGGPAMWHGSGTGSLSSLSSRPPNLRLGMGLPLSRVYAEYWAGTLELHSLEGYGVDAFLQISRLGNKNEQLTTRASMDAV